MVFPFEREAQQGLPIPEGLDFPDQFAFQFLRRMYRDLRTGVLTMEQAMKEKGKMTYQYHKAKGILQHASTMGAYGAELRKAIEAAHSNYRKNPNKETADALSAVLDGKLWWSGKT